jgi:hypothetical protein
VNFSTFNPVYPILACGLNDGNILIIEGQTNTDLVVMWENKRWFKINGTSAMTALGWNVKHALFLDFSLIFKTNLIII